jgi:hypothetical protein
VTDVAFQATEMKPICRVTQMMAEQILGQSFGDSVKDDLSPRSAVDQHWFNPAQVESTILTKLKSACMTFMQADSVEGTNGDDRLVWNNFGFYQEMAICPVSDHLTPEQSPFKRFEQADLLNNHSRGQLIFQNGLELITGEDGGKVEDVLNSESVQFVVGHNLQVHFFAKEDQDLLSVPSGEELGKSRFDFLDDFGCG